MIMILMCCETACVREGVGRAYACRVGRDSMGNTKDV